MNVHNYECLATLKVNMQRVFIDEKWVVNKYLVMKKKKLWKELETDDDMNVLNLEQEILVESLGVHVDSLPPITAEQPEIVDDEPGVVEADAIVVDPPVVVLTT